MIKWNDKFSVGIAIIDNEHMKIFGLINKVIHAKEYNNNPDEIKEVLVDMDNYASTHFKTEERYMEQFDYPEYQNHKEEHNQFSNEIVSYIDKVIKGDFKIASEILEYLKQWLVKHIQVTDRQYIDCFKKNGLK